MSLRTLVHTERVVVFHLIMVVDLQGSWQKISHRGFPFVEELKIVLSNCFIML